MHSTSSQTVIHNAGGAANSRPALGASMGAWIARLAGFALAGLLLMSLPARAQTVTPAGTSIDNVATVDYVGPGGTPTTVTTNRVSAIVTTPPTISAVAILRAAGGSGAPSMAGPTQCSSSSGMVTLPAPLQADGTALDPSQPIPLASTATSARRRGGVRARRWTRTRIAMRPSSTISTCDSAHRPAMQRRCASPRPARTPASSSATSRRARSRSTAGNCVLEVERNAQIRRSTSIAVDAARHQQCERAGRSVRRGLRFAHRHADQRRARAADRCGHRHACRRLRRRRREQLPVRNAHRLAR